MANVIEGCLNHYTEDELYELFGTHDKEIDTCIRCSNHSYSSGIISCKYITGEKRLEEAQ